MSFFVLVYDRAGRRVTELREFSETDVEHARAFRLESQRQAIRENLDEEIVLFQATSEEALRRTHGSYFLSERELIDRMREAAGAG